MNNFGIFSILNYEKIQSSVLFFTTLDKYTEVPKEMGIDMCTVFDNKIPAPSFTNFILTDLFSYLSLPV
jgi:hypothetical protein